MPPCFDAVPAYERNHDFFFFSVVEKVFEGHAESFVFMNIVLKKSIVSLY